MHSFRVVISNINMTFILDSCVSRSILNSLEHSIRIIVRLSSIRVFGDLHNLSVVFTQTL